jgi:hypothetical protein
MEPKSDPEKGVEFRFDQELCVVERERGEQRERRGFLLLRFD